VSTIKGEGRRKILGTCRLYLITPPAFEPVRFADELTRALDAGDVACVQIRLKDVPDDAIKRAAERLLPVTAANVVLAYHLPGFSGNLKLSRDAYAGIFLGTITSWDDPKIAESNQGASLPKLKISPIHRQAASGTTFVFTQHLSAINDAWKRGPGKGMTVVWPAGTAARGSDDMVTLIQKEPGSIGYLGYGHAEKSKLPMAWLQNKSGEYVKPSMESGQATLNSAPLPENLRGWVPDPEGKDSYPIVTYTWLLVRKHDGNSRTTAALKDVLKYCVTDGQKDSVALGYIPLPEKVRQAELQAVDAMVP